MKYWTVDLENCTTHVKVSVYEIQANDVDEATAIALDTMRGVSHRQRGSNDWMVTGIDLADDTGDKH